MVELRSLPFEITNYEKINEFIPSQSSVVTSINETTPQPAPVQTSGAVKSRSGDLNLKSASIDAEYETILAALKQVNFNKSKAAKLMKIDRKISFYSSSSIIFRVSSNYNHK